MKTFRPIYSHVVLLTCLLCGMSHVAFAAKVNESLSLADTMKSDALLRNICFVDEQTGWAVGDRGAIWHTQNAGETWQRQVSPVSCPLSSVCFLDTNRGWITGGQTVPFTHSTQGVLLRTTDGGKTWQAIDHTLLPAIEKIQFFNAKEGVAIGSSSALFPSGVFATRDGGRTWRQLATEQSHQWSAADFLDMDHGALVDLTSTTHVFSQNKVRPTNSVSYGLRKIYDLQLGKISADRTTSMSYLVGDGGLILASNDSGRSWQTSAGLGRNIAARSFNFRAVCTRGSQVWVVGDPGTKVFYSADNGNHWEMFDTGSSIPLHDITFTSETNGWAVGSLGTILATTDAGQTWHVQHSAGKRAAVLAIFAQPEDVPLDLIAKLSAEEGYHCVVCTLFRQPGTNGPATEKQTEAIRVHEALVALGATQLSAEWQFPLDQKLRDQPAEAIITELNRVTDSHAIEMLQENLVRKIRTWQPSLVITCGPNSENAEGLQQLVNQLVTQAVETAADSTRNLEQLTSVGLKPAAVRRVAGFLPQGQRGHWQFDPNTFSLRLSKSLADWVAPSRGLVYEKFTSTTGNQSLTWLTHQGEAPISSRDLLAGLGVTFGSDARRLVSLPPTGDVNQLRQIAQRKRNMNQLLDQQSSNPAWLGQVVKMTEHLPAQTSGDLLFQLANGYQSTGKQPLAAKTYELLCQQYPKHQTTEAALTWLVQFYASGENAHRLGEPNSRNVRPAIYEEERRAKVAKQKDKENPLKLATNNGVQQSNLRLERAAALGKFVRDTRPEFYARPNIRFPLAVTARGRGYSKEADRALLTIGNRGVTDAWRDCVQAERWLKDRTKLPPKKPILDCNQAAQKPYLDGNLLDAIWSKHPGVQFAQQTSVHMAYDRDYLYLAASCPKVTGANYPEQTTPTTHDADLSEQDRITFRIDIDRDYTSAFEFTIDARGHTAEACFNDTTWNPTWYVATSASETHWTIEAAIPLAALVDHRPKSSDAWAVGVQRTIPNETTQAWPSNKGETDSPKLQPSAFGLLLFE